MTASKIIKLTVDASGNVNETYAQDDISNPSLRLQNDWLEGVGTPTLTIKNVSKEYISVCAEKDWGNTAQDRQLPVVVELCHNNTPPLSSENGFNRQTLSADNNWTCEWTDLLLFIDGKALADFLEI